MRPRSCVVVALSALIATTFGTSAYATIIKGTVTNSKTGDPLPFANVLLRGTTPAGEDVRRGVMGGSTGLYVLANLPAGSFQIRVIYIGYGEFSDSLHVGATDTLSLDVSLTTELIVTQKIIIDDDKYAIERQFQPSFMEFDMNTLKTIPAVGESDPIRTLQLLPGIQAASDISSGLYIRGGGPDQTLVLLDGVTVYNPTHAFGFFSTFNADAVDDIVLYKGAYPAEYSGRLGAVLDVHSFADGQSKISGKGGISTIASRLQFEGAAGRAKWFVAGRRTYLEPILDAARRSNNDIPYYYFYDFNSKVTFKTTSGTAEISGYRGRDDILFELEDGSTIDINWGNTLVSGSYSHLFGEEFYATLKVSSSEYESGARIDLLSTPLRINNHIRDITVRGDLDWQNSPRNRFTVGTQVSRYDVLYNQAFNKDQGIDYRGKPWEYAIYVDDLYRPFDGTTFRFGSRARFLSEGDRFFVEPRFAASQSIGRVRLRTGGGIYNQYLQLVTTEGFSAADFYVPIDETAVPGQSMQGVFGLDVDVSSTYLFSAEGYYTVLRNLVVFDDNVTPDQESFTASDIFVTGGQGRAYGLELFAHRRRGDLTGWIGYTMGWTRRQFLELNDGKVFAPKYDRRHDVNVVGNFRDGPWTYGATFVAATGQAFTPASARYQIRSPGNGGIETNLLAAQRNSARLLPYHRLDVNVARDFSMFGLPAQWTFEVFNLYSRRNEWFVQYDEEKGTANMVNQLPIIPSLGVNFKF